MSDAAFDPELDALVASRRLIVCVGPGGVGKTTTSAALALRAARMGRRALVLTIDPARRLADALGLDGLDDAIKPVPVLDDVSPLGERTMGTLDAAMLDTKASYDALLTRITEPEAREKIFANRAYQAFSRTMARSHAYVAMERLLHVVTEGDWDLVVLDTPPTRSALDIFDAPRRLVGFLDEGVVQWFLRAPADDDGEAEGTRSGRGGGFGGRAALGLLERLVGGGVVGELVSFFRVLAHLRQGFRDRAERAVALLEEPATAFALIAAPTPTGLADATQLLRELEAREAHVSLAVFNRAYLPEPGAPRGTPLAPIARAPLPPELDPSLVALAEKVWTIREERLSRERGELFAMRAMLAAGPPGLRGIVLPIEDRELTEVADLADLLESPLPLSRLER